jgi:hypothetical protein
MNELYMKNRTGTPVLFGDIVQVKFDGIMRDIDDIIANNK